MTFYSKRDWSILLAMGIPPLLLFFVFAITGTWLVSFLMLLLAVIFLWGILTIRYTIVGRNLTIKCVYNSVIDINNITELHDAKKDISGAPAASFDRIMIIYSDRKNRQRKICISPKQEKEFIQELLKINRQIKSRF